MKQQPNNTTEQPPSAPPDKTKQPDPLDELRAENERLREQIKLRDAHDTLTHKLKKAGARTPKLLLEAAKHALKFTAEGLLENAGELVDGLKDKYPEQFGNEPHIPHPSIDAGAGGRSRPALTKEALAKMKPSEIADLDWSEVKRTLAG